MISWVAVTGRLDLGAICAFPLIFMWTPPHFGARPVREGDLCQGRHSHATQCPWPVAKTRRQILIYPRCACRGGAAALTGIAGRFM